MERINYDLLFRWFVGLGMDDKVWNHSVFSKNRDRLMTYDVDELLFQAIKKQGYAKKLLSRDHFTVDGTLIEACASLKSFKPKRLNDDSDEGENFHGQKRSNATHESTTDPDSHLFRKGLGKEAGTSQEWDATVEMLAEQSTSRRQTVGGDKGYDVGRFVEPCRGLGFTPHVAARKKGSQIDGRTLTQVGYEISQRKRKRVEEAFGWMKTFGLMDKLRHRGQAKVDWLFRFTVTAYNMTRLKGLMT